ncbi:uncharacterized protein LAESUDRAFT_468090 [Laetiporus sulphureus 93-53]|uniref:Uncharacterized protein n=1 Tax=Laetiporus sulphureus 93-53 TaxID=1314785 RepID=A0A165G8R7_9APHY|nr:uncharacterized protein LAESUDRAFT_468090 [Laetiporus sulphureus 93-53]KZT09988.1 hypothetical protein LAESUDRAFT_468090 [Laetiporus sulphureus 93-53]
MSSVTLMRSSSWICKVNIDFQIISTGQCSLLTFRSLASYAVILAAIHLISLVRVQSVHACSLAVY